MEMIIADIEADLIPSTVVYCIGVKSLATGEKTLYGPDDIPAGIARLEAASRDGCIIGHNFLGYDAPTLRRLHNADIHNGAILDTQAIAQFLDPSHPSHSLSNWGKRLGVFKIEFNDFSQYSDKMGEYCLADLDVTEALYRYFLPRLAGMDEALRLEHQTFELLSRLMQNGMAFDLPGALKLADHYRQRLGEIKRGLLEAFPPRWARGDLKTPSSSRPLKAGDGVHVHYTHRDASYNEVKLAHLNPNSRLSVAARLKSDYGWTPSVFNVDKKTGQPNVKSPKLTEEVLADLDYDCIPLLREWYKTDKVASMLAGSQFKAGSKGWIHKLGPDGRLHGYVRQTGTRTGRMSHSDPNLAQISRKKEIRELFIAPPGRVLVDVDADGLEARIMAHYLTPFDKGRFRDILLTGNSEDGTDIHSRNQRAAGLHYRKNAKTFLYALVYGAGAFTLGMTVKKDYAEAGVRTNLTVEQLGREAEARLLKSFEGYGALVDAIEDELRMTGHLTGLDGRRIDPKAAHTAANALFQSAGAIAMKRAAILADRKITRAGLDCLWTGNIHDEFLFETSPEDAEAVRDLAAASIAEAGEYFNLRCPLVGNGKVGKNWHEVH